MRVQAAVPRTRVSLFLLVEKILSRIAVRNECGRNLGNQLLDLCVLDRRQQRVGYGVDYGVVKINFMLQERAIKRGAAL